MRLPRSLTRESKPEARTVPNQVPFTRPRSTSRSRAPLRASAISRPAAAGSRTGSPRARAKSFPVPAATRPSGVRVPATAWRARFAMPSPPTAIRAPVPPSTAARARVRASSAFSPRTVRTENPAARNAEAAGCAAWAPRPRPAVGLTKRVISLVTALTLRDLRASSGHVVVTVDPVRARLLGQGAAGPTRSRPRRCPRA